jgi:SAM-dependent methyltransferase
MTRHLDLGCGPVPRNPYLRDELFGVDLSDRVEGDRVRRANLATQPIPFESDRFDSVSAYDFLEHVPRVLPTADGQSTRFPFIELMNEVWRVLRPGGLFYAVTPVYPSPAAFMDPTHVNIMTTSTHTYFTRPQRMARMYGFTGDFALRRVQLTRPDPDLAYVPPTANAWQRLRLAHRIWRGACGHMVWEFEALKSGGGGGSESA